MKTLLFAIGLLVTTASFTPYIMPEQYVYIDSTDSKAEYYHAGDDCKDIKKGDKTKKVSLSDAVNKYHLKPCPDCYKPKK
ncbi:MAG TPA: hypothetical protein VK890_02815 [Bacteroidia bacterium]|jgi:hypothetical protein|nr:hypothetical protein [Bacteroidia bacterium]